MDGGDPRHSTQLRSELPEDISVNEVRVHDVGSEGANLVEKRWNQTSVEVVPGFPHGYVDTRRLSSSTNRQPSPADSTHIRDSTPTAPRAGRSDSKWRSDPDTPFAR